MEVFVTGSTGFVGRQVVQELLAKGHTVRCLVRSGAVPGPTPSNLQWVRGDVTQPEGLAAAMAGCQAVVHLVGIIREFPARGITFQRLHFQATANMVAAAQQAGVSRYLHMSALEPPSAPVAAYHQTKLQAEAVVQNSGLAYTIFRPSIIYGPEDAFNNLFKGQIERFGVVPVIGTGQYLLQPIPVWQVAQAFAVALDRPQTSCQSYDVGGPEPVSFNELIDTLAQVLGRRVWKLHLPVGPIRFAARLFQNFAWFPLTVDQLTMLLAGNTCDPRPFFAAFDLTPISLADGLASYLRPII